MQNLYTKNSIYFLLALVGFFFISVWTPQFQKGSFTPANISYSMPEIGNDLKGIYVSAKRALEGKNERFLNEDERHEFDQAIGGIIHAYGPIATLMLMPFAKLSFEHVRILLCLFSLASFFTILFLESKRFLADKDLLVFSLIISLLLLMFSPALNLLIERAQMEIFIFVALYIFLRGFRTEMRWYHLACLSFAIHLKLWPIIFLPLFLSRKNFIKGVYVGVGAALPHLLFSPLFSFFDYLTAVKAYGEHTKNFFGGNNISFSSFLFRFTKIHWVVWTSLIFAGLTFLQIKFFSKEQNSQRNISNKELPFWICLCFGMIITGCEFQYVLVSLTLLVPYLLANTEDKKQAFLLGLIFCAFTYDTVDYGYMKSILIFLLGLWLTRDFVRMSQKLRG